MGNKYSAGNIEWLLSHLNEYDGNKTVLTRMIKIMPEHALNIIMDPKLSKDYFKSKI